MNSTIAVPESFLWPSLSEIRRETIRGIVLGTALMLVMAAGILAVGWYFGMLLLTLGIAGVLVVTNVWMVLYVIHEARSEVRLSREERAS